jgi:hypothetical protein
MASCEIQPHNCQAGSISEIGRMAVAIVAGAHVPQKQPPRQGQTGRGGIGGLIS